MRAAPRAGVGPPGLIFRFFYQGTGGPPKPPPFGDSKKRPPAPRWGPQDPSPPTGKTPPGGKKTQKHKTGPSRPVFISKKIEGPPPLRPARGAKKKTRKTNFLPKTVQSCFFSSPPPLQKGFFPRNHFFLEAPNPCPRFGSSEPASRLSFGSSPPPPGKPGESQPPTRGGSKKPLLNPKPKLRL